MLLRLRPSWLAPLVAAAALAAASTAAARPPLHESFTTSDSFSTPCTGFDDLATVVADISQTTFLDDLGNPVTFIAHVSFRSTDANSVTGKVIDSRGSFTASGDLATGVVAFTGQINMANKRGAGTVKLVQSTGRVVQDANNATLFSSAKAFRDTTGDVYCTALA